MGEAKILGVLFIFSMSFKLESFIMLKDKKFSILRKIIQDKMYCKILYYLKYKKVYKQIT